MSSQNPNPPNFIQPTYSGPSGVNSGTPPKKNKRLLDRKARGETPKPKAEDSCPTK